MPAAERAAAGRGRPRVAALRARRALGAAALRPPPRPAVRLQRRRERALRGRRDRHVRAHLQPELLHQPAGLHVPAARGVRLGFGGRDGVSAAYAADPSDVFAVARALVGACSARSPSGCCAWAGARLFDRRVGFVAAALLAVAFLPVHYGAPRAQRRADARAAVPGARRRRRASSPAGALLDYALAGVGLGLACATKYTGGIVLLPLLAAALAGRGQAVAPAARRARARGRRWRSPRFLRRQPVRAARLRLVPRRPERAVAASSDGGGKLGLTAEQRRPLLPRTFDLGARLAARARRARRRGRAGGARLAPRARARAPRRSLFLLFMGTQDRYFARWLLPLYPFLCLLAAYGGVAAFTPLLRAPGARRGAVARRAAVRAGARVRDPQRRRALARRHAPARARLDGREPAGRDEGGGRAGDARRVGQRPRPPAARDHRQRRALGQVADVALAAQRRRHAAQGRAGPIVKLEDYERTLFPQLVKQYADARLLHGADRLDPVRARARRAGGRAAGARVLRRAQAQGPGRVPRAPAAAGLLVRLLLQLATRCRSTAQGRRS